MGLGKAKMLSQGASAAPAPPSGTDNFNTVIYSGNGSSQNVDTVGFQPDLVILKAMSASVNNMVTDSVRGASYGLATQVTDQHYLTSGKAVNSFRTLGFSVSGQTNGGFRVNGAAGQSFSGTPPNYCAWCWKGGGAAQSNTDGTISSSVSANPTAGFSIVSYSGGSGTVGHGLGVTPSMIIQKRYDSGGEPWYTYFSPGVLDSNYRFLEFNNAGVGGTTGSTAPTTTTFNPVSGSGSYIAYCFADIAGYQSIGNYTGTGNTTGEIVDLGFTPRFLVQKAYTSTEFGGAAWHFVDSTRSTSNPRNQRLYGNANYPNATNQYYNVDFLTGATKGFQMTSGQANFGNNTLNVKYMYWAIG